MVKKVNKIPSTPGVYIFSKETTPLYVGKAANLKKRLSSYFKKNAGAKVSSLLKDAAGLTWEELSSEAEALIREAELIKRHRPKYNILMRDDKNYFFVGITREDFPRIVTTHQPLQVKSQRLKVKSNYVGPFTNGRALKITLKLLRRVFPYCTCKKPHKGKCMQSELGLCPGYCCMKVDATQPRSRLSCINEYGENIKKIRAVLAGKKRRVLQNLKREMAAAARKEKFERAARLRDEITGMENVFAHRKFLMLPRRGFGNWGKISRTISEVAGIRGPMHRVEGYDISNISGVSATGSMVVFINGRPEKSAYRKFKIKTVRQQSDVDMLKEVIRRRLGHREWAYPELMLIDGGKPQLHAALQEVRIKNKESRLRRGSPRAARITVAALAKREEELYPGRGNAPIRLKNLPQRVAFFFQQVRDESHRFAKKYHHKLREMSFHEK